VAGLAVLALSTLAPYFADRYVHGVVEDGWRDDPQAAITALDRAHDLNRFDDFPLLLKAQIQSQTGDEPGALATLREAADLRPEEYAVHYLIADLESETNPGLARNEIRVALELNPLDLKVRALAGELGIPDSQLVPLPE
jgi:tetratricopeptide (TPR) repeat protein